MADDILGVGRLPLFLHKVHHPLDLLGGDEAALDAPGLALAQGGVKHITFTHQLLCAGVIQYDPRLHGGGHGKGNAAGNVGLHKARDNIGGGALGGNDQMHPGGAAHLGHPADGVLHLLGRHQHQVGQLVDDHHHRGQLFQGLACFVRLGLSGQGVVRGQILHAVFREELIALHHFKHRPLQGSGGLFGVCNHGDEQVRDAVIGGQLHHFRVHHDEADLLRGGLIEQTHNEGVGTHGLTGAGGAGDKHMGELCDVADNAVAADILAHGEGHGGLVAGELPGLDDLPDAHRGHGPVGHLNAHRGNLARHRGHPDAAHAQGQGNVIGQVCDFGELHPLGLSKLIAGDAGTPDHLAGLSIHAKAAQGVRQALGIAAHLRPGGGKVAGAALLQQGDGGILVLLLGLG